MVRKEDVLAKGREESLRKRERRGIVYSAAFAEENSPAAPAYILAEQRFISGHDDTAFFVEIIDTDGKIAERWKFFDCIRVFDEPQLYNDDCLILYLQETYRIPVKYGWGYEGQPHSISWS